MTYWMCDKCNFVVEATKPPDPCPSCNIKCTFSDVTCYTPECGGIGSLDSRLVAQRVVKREKPGKIMRFSDLVRGRSSQGKETHMPVIELIRGKGRQKKDQIEITVGREQTHPQTTDHYIKWIQAFGVQKDGHIMDMGRMSFSPETAPEFTFEVDSAQYDHIFAFSYCSQHGVWEQHFEI